MGRASRGWRRELKIFLLGVLVASTVGCASLGVYNPATGRREFIMIPTSEEVKMGRAMHGQLSGQFPIVTRDPRTERLERIGARVAQVSDRQDYEYHFYLLNKDEVNAFTTPGGNIYFFTGLLKKLKTDDQVAAVLAHEIGHCAARHTIKKFQAAVGYDLVGSILFSAVSADDQVKRIASMGTDVLMQIVFSAYSRQDEIESDRLAIKYMDLAGFNPQGMVETLQILEQEEKAGGAPLVLRSHPYAKDRLEKVKEIIARLPQN